MAWFLRTSGRPLISSSSFRTLISQLHPQFSVEPKTLKNIVFLRTQLSRSSMTKAQTLPKSPFESNIIRILRKDIEFWIEYVPPQQPVSKFNAFTVEDRPNGQWITFRGTSSMDENIQIKATMFDASILFPKDGDDGTREDFRLHISLRVDISKGDGTDSLKFVCSAWPDCLEIHKVYFFKHDQLLRQPYMGPNFRDLDQKLQKALYEFLKARGVNDDLSVFLHEFIMNKERIELIQWLRKVKSYMEN